MPHATGDDEHSAPNDQYRADLGMLGHTTEQQLQVSLPLPESRFAIVDDCLRFRRQCVTRSVKSLLSRIEYALTSRTSPQHPEIRERERRAELAHELSQAANRSIEEAFRRAIHEEDPSDLHHNVDAILALGEVVCRLGALPANLRVGQLSFLLHRRHGLS